MSRLSHSLLPIGRRLLAALPVLLCVTLLTFVVLNILPGNAARQLLGATATEEQVSALEQELGLDRPASDRYLRWLGNAFQGNFGASIASKQPVRKIIFERLPVSGLLIIYSLFLSLMGSVALALIAAHKPDGVADRVVMVLGMIGLSSANYVVALILVLIFSVHMNLFPAIGFHPPSDGFKECLRSLTLPAISIAFPLSSLYARFLRGDLVDQLQREDYVLTAIAKGLRPWKILVHHVLRNSAFGLLTLVGLNFGALIGGTVITEQIFALPGLGQLLVSAIGTRDYAVVEAVTIIIAFATVLAGVLVELLHALLDPRVPHSWKR